MRWWCGRGCTWDEAVAATHTRKTDWFLDRPLQGRTMSGSPVRIVDTYDYTDHAGKTIFQVVRTDPKGFYQRRPAPDGHGWINTVFHCFAAKGKDGQWYYWPKKEQVPTGLEPIELEPVNRVPYQWLDIRKRTDQPVLVVEGEKSAKLLRDLGFVSTCSPGGAGKWPVQFGGYLAQRRVVIFPDNDEPGFDHAGRVAGSAILYGCESVRMIRPGYFGYQLAESADVWDWLQTQGDPKSGSLKYREQRRLATINLVRQFPELTWVKGDVLAHGSALTETKVKRTAGKKIDERPAPGAQATIRG